MMREQVKTAHERIGFALARRSFAALVLLIGMGSASAQPMSADEAAVRALPTDVAAVFPDGEAVARIMAADADYVIGDGTHLRGRDEIAGYFRRLLEGGDSFGFSLRGVRAIAEVVDVRFLSTDVAVLHTRGGLILPGEAVVSPARSGLQTWVAHRIEGRWMVAAYQNTRVQAHR